MRTCLRGPYRSSVALGALLVLAGCAGPKPILYPNAHSEEVGAAAAEQDIAACRGLAETQGASPGDDKTGKVATNTAGGAAIGGAGGAAAGAVFGSVGRGAAAGAAGGAAAGLVRGLFSSPKPSPAYRNFVNRCLAERGYEVVGWD